MTLAPCLCGRPARLFRFYETPTEAGAHINIDCSGHASDECPLNLSISRDIASLEEADEFVAAWNSRWNAERLGLACEGNGLAGFTSNGEMWFQPPADEIVSAAFSDPVAWRVKDFADGWILCHSWQEARREAEGAGNLVQGLYAHPDAKIAVGEIIRTFTDAERRALAYVLASGISAQTSMTIHHDVLACLESPAEAAANAARLRDIAHEADKTRKFLALLISLLDRGALVISSPVEIPPQL